MEVLRKNRFQYNKKEEEDEKLLLGALCLVVGATAFAAEKVIGVSLPGPVGYL